MTNHPAQSSDAQDDSFESLAQNLISWPYAAADEIADRAGELSAPLLQPRTRRRSHTQIALATLFDFTRSDNSLDFYWKGAIKMLLSLHLSSRRVCRYAGCLFDCQYLISSMTTQYFGHLDTISCSCTIFYYMYIQP